MNTRQKIYIDIDSDDDFLFDMGDGSSESYATYVCSSKGEAIKLLNSFTIVKSFDWVQDGNTFTRQSCDNPTNHWFQKEINKAVNNLTNDVDAHICGNQTLIVEAI